MALLSDLAWKFGTYGNQIQNNLFQTNYTNGTVVAQDLFAINLQRGRDHGLPTYVQMLKATQNLTITNFTQLWPTLMNQCNGQQLQSVYGYLFSNSFFCFNLDLIFAYKIISNVADIDLYAGGLSERVVGANNSQIFAVGPTFGRIIMEQFGRIKNSDRWS